MSLNGKDYCNPSVENIAKEIFLIAHCLIQEKYLMLYKIKIFETPNCWSEIKKDNISTVEAQKFMAIRQTLLENYKQEKGVVKYDDREQ